MNQFTRLKPLFHPGRLLVTHAALATLRVNGIPVISVLLRHIAGDWGIVSEDDRQQNDLSIGAGLRLLSLYRLPDGARIFVSTEWDRSSTAIQLFKGNPSAPQSSHTVRPIRSRRPIRQMHGNFPGACP
ncbi:hypothetical protein EOS_27325 [Caballeronia mineralivorans PML1(12)]|uniref:Plasmid related protein n=2 Tax=Caballeronia mineralivorans TaxID=2010198 RepID=A0A0J1FTM1_9BURK|nr:hypothetical protein EOS_27325 [Caballeronia mineralivorans PML1(12)]